MWTIWRGRNLCTFDGIELSVCLELKLHLLQTFFDWLVALSGYHFSLLEEFLDLCHFDLHLLYPKYTTCVLGILYFHFIFNEALLLIPAPPKKKSNSYKHAQHIEIKYKIIQIKNCKASRLISSNPFQ